MFYFYLKKIKPPTREVFYWHMGVEQLAERIMHQITVNAVSHGIPEPKLKLVSDEHGTPFVQRYKRDDSDIFHPVTEEYLEHISKPIEFSGTIYISPVNDEEPIPLPIGLRTTVTPPQKENQLVGTPFSSRKAMADRRSHTSVRRGPGRYRRSI